MKCSKTFTLHIGPSADPIAWWPFDFLPPPAVPPPPAPWLDSILNLPIIPYPGSTGVDTIIAGGHVAECLNVNPPALATENLIMPQSNVALHFTTGFTIACWLRVHNMGGNDDWGMEITAHNAHWDIFGVTPPAIWRAGILWQAGATTLRIQLEEVAILQIDDTFPFIFVDNVWYLIMVGYDQTTGLMHYVVNNNLPVYGPTSYTLAAAWSEGRLSFGQTDINLTGCNFDIDEFCYFNHVLDAAQRADLWNGGAGRTWP